ncbi:hypothetical protein HIM_10617 [Hirsutella minnesotensis 3608]|uniref:non-specific serine/threonine protein kinase n=1 Tax=Hirsutella minnesotensis 3608 TaxID=1043627 RepID=A0A0F7ZJV3_9HYPO|nr:hypothetical protein HIM_10617 [Hirsutella minnesotensis 3608]
MPPPPPHRLALFSLKPLNERALDVVVHPNNEHLVTMLKDGEYVLDIGHVRPMSGDTATLATLGRNGDVFVGGSSIAKVQCSFEMDPNTSVVMFYDRSHSLTTQVWGENATPFEHGRPRKIVVHEGLNTIIGMGGERRNLVLFELKWPPDPAEAMERVRNRQVAALEENPRLARTIDEADTVLPSRRETRLHTAGPGQRQMRYKILGDPLGSGQFGVVQKVVNVDTGKLMAVKILKRPTVTSGKALVALKREIETLSRLSHPHIVDYIASQGWDGPEVEIFMGLMQGTLESLVKSGISTPVIQLGECVFHQMLQAIDCLAFEGIIHRDVKPENILYVWQSSGYHFQLGDFGGRQTHKVDVWSLYVTMLWTLDMEDFRHQSNEFRSVEDAQKAVLSIAAAAEAVSNIREMAMLNPDERASAAQMLVKCYNGLGLTTPRHLVVKAGTKIPGTADAAPALTGRVEPDKHRAVSRDMNPASAAAANQFRPNKSRPRSQTQPRSPIGPAAIKKRPRRALAIEDGRIPGSFPDA